MFETIEGPSSPQLSISIAIEVTKARSVLGSRVRNQPLTMVASSTPRFGTFAGGTVLALEAALGLDLVGVAVNGVGGVGVGAGPAPGLEEDVRAELTDEVLEHVGGLVLHEPVLVEHGEALGAEGVLLLGEGAIACVGHGLLMSSTSQRSK